MKHTGRITAVVLTLATVLSALLLASCGGEKEPEFTVPRMSDMTEQEQSSAESSSMTESSASAESESGNTETGSTGTETTGVAPSVTPIDYSTIPLPGEDGYKDRITMKMIGSSKKATFDEGFESYPRNYLKEVQYALSYLLKTQHAEELEKEPIIAGFVEKMWNAAQGYRPVMFDAVSKGQNIFPLPVQNAYPTVTFENKVYTLFQYSLDSVGLLYTTAREFDKKTGNYVYVEVFERTEDDYQAIRDLTDFFDAYYGVKDYPSVKKALDDFGSQISYAVNDPGNEKKNGKFEQFVISYMGYSNKLARTVEYDEEKMKVKVTLDNDCYDYFELLTGMNDPFYGGPKHHFCTQREFWFDAVSSAQFALTGVRENGFAPELVQTFYLLANSERLTDREAVIGNAALKSAVERFLGISSPSVRDLSAVVGIAWTKDTITLTDRSGNSKSYPSGGVCKDASVFDDFPSLAALTLDMSELPDDVLTRNCFLSVEDLTVIGSRAYALDLSTLTMLKILVCSDCPELRGIKLGEYCRELYHFEFSGEKNRYIRSLDFLSGVAMFWEFDTRALSIDSIGGFRGKGIEYNERGGVVYFPNGRTKLAVGDIFDADFFRYYYNVFEINIYGEAPSDEEILAKLFEDEEHAKILNNIKIKKNLDFSINRY